MYKIDNTDLINKAAAYVSATDADVIFVEQRFKHEFHCLFMSGHRTFDNDFLFSFCGLSKEGAVHRNAFAKTFCDYFLVIHIDKLVFKRTATGVYNKNFHIAPSLILPARL